MRSLADVTLSFHSLGEIDLETRAAVARAAGFRQLGLSIRRTLGWLADHPITELTDLLERHGLTVGQLEVLTPLLVEPDPLTDGALALAGELRCPSIQISGPSDLDLAAGAGRLRTLAGRAGEVGATVSFEFLPWTNVPTVAAAAELVERADHAGAGICVDIWHLYRSGGAPRDLDALWPLVNSVQLNDGTLAPVQHEDLLDDCLRNRRPPGEGEFDLIGLVAAAERSMPDGVLSLEVISDELRALSPAEVTARLASTTKSMLATVEEVVRA